MTETLVAVNPPSPKKKQGPDAGESPREEAFEPVAEAGPGRELTPSELAVIKQMVIQAKEEVAWKAQPGCSPCLPAPCRC